MRSSALWSLNAYFVAMPTKDVRKIGSKYPMKLFCAALHVPRKLRACRLPRHFVEAHGKESTQA